MKPSKSEIARMERAYRETHDGCAMPYEKDGKWYLHKARPVQLHHVAHGSNKIHHPANYLMLCVQWGTGGCHSSFHLSKDSLMVGERMLRLYAVKYIFKEITLHQVDFFMKNRNWWREEDGNIVAHQKMLNYAMEMESLLETEAVRWNLSKTKGAR